MTVLDLAESYVVAGRRLTLRAGLEALVTHQVGNALEMPFEDASFDAVWTQNSGMNIAEKDALYREFRRVLRDGGTLATQEPMAGPVAQRVYPLMWASGPELDHLGTQQAMRASIEAAGFRVLAWNQVTPPRPPSGTTLPAHAIQRLVMGNERLAEIMRAARVNEDEHRMVMVQAACEAGAASAHVLAPNADR